MQCMLVRTGCLRLNLAATPETLPVMTAAPSLPNPTKADSGTSGKPKVLPRHNQLYHHSVLLF